MEELHILGYKNPGDFRTRHITVARHGIRYDLNSVGEEIEFKEMMKERVKVDYEQVSRGIICRGHTFANMGIGSMLTLDHQGNNYVLGLMQGRPEMGDAVFNPIGGYVKTAHMDNPIYAFEEEVSEELLPVARNGTLIRIARNSRLIGTPFSEHFQDHENEFFLRPGAKYTAPNLDKGISIAGRAVKEPNAILFELERNTAKLVFSYHLETYIDLEKEGVSLHNAEDKPNPLSGMLDVRFRPNRIMLIQLAEGNLTDRVKTMKDGKLQGVDPREVSLSEVFTADKNNISSRNKIRLVDFLESQ